MYFIFFACNKQCYNLNFIDIFFCYVFILAYFVYQQGLVQGDKLIHLLFLFFYAAGMNRNLYSFCIFNLLLIYLLHPTMITLDYDTIIESKSVRKVMFYPLRSMVNKILYDEV